MQKDVKTQKITNYTSSLTLNNFCYEIKISHKLPVIMISFSKTSNPSFCWQQTVVFFFQNESNATGTYKRFYTSYFFLLLVEVFMRDNLFLGMNYNYRLSKIQVPVPFHYNQFWCITFIDRDNKQRLPWVLFFRTRPDQRQDDPTYKRFVCAGSRHKNSRRQLQRQRQDWRHWDTSFFSGGLQSRIWYSLF